MSTAVEDGFVSKNNGHGEKPTMHVQTESKIIEQLA